MNHQFEKHENCQIQNCPVCDGGLSVCAVCGGAEGSLTTDCIGRKLDERELQEVYLGASDFVGNTWVVGTSPNSPSAYKSLVMPELPPVKNENPAVWPLVIADIKSRDKFGLKKYGTQLQGFNGRDALVDMYQELLDAVVYCRQLIFERDRK
jgi:hypothetical protein